MAKLIGPTFRAPGELAQLCERVDLITFPEAFAPARALLEVLRSAHLAGPFGCIHVGLRPDASDLHLFSLAEVQKLVDDIKAVDGVVDTDFAAFELWLAEEHPSHRFNIGCLFTVDGHGALRVCLHPKLVAARVEHSALPDRHLTEGRLLSLVTLVPIDKRFKRLNIQPLICSDMLDLETDRKSLPPIPAISARDCPLDDPPDHVDLVSVVTCTPQVITLGGEGKEIAREWHEDFLDSFCRAAKSPVHSRHHSASFVMANFQKLGRGSGSRPAGLSGLFQPIGPRIENAGNEVELCYNGRTGIGQNHWFPPGSAIFDRDHQWRGYLAQLKPSPESNETGEGGAAVRMFEFVLPAMLRDTSPWKPNDGLNQCSVIAGRWEGGSDRLVFGEAEQRS